MDKNSFAPTPPMGWNSYDYYCTEVTEAQVKANAQYMAEHLRPFGWEYIVIDISWYELEAGSQSHRFQYIPFAGLVMDEYSRLVPDPARFPSAADGQGFRPLADYIHSLGLKFGIHIMRGIPRLAAHSHGKLLGTDVTADQIADPSKICAWNPYMYGLRPSMPESQLYYDSIMALYASWGVDFIKCDDICREDAYSAHDEIAMLHKAIDKCGRPIVLSLSPGPAKITEAEFYAENANMWRITDDFWDSWPLLKDMFRRCELWQGKRRPGCFPDCDMLPVGIIGGCFGKRQERLTGFTQDEQVTMMTLWCIFGAPLMIGGEMTRLDDFTLHLLTNPDVLHMLKHAQDARQVTRTEEEAIWVASDPESGCGYIAMFNLADEERAVSCWVGQALAAVGKSYDGGPMTELWTGKPASFSGGGLTTLVPAHGAALFRY